MITGKSLYAYNKDTGQREEIKIEASSITFANSPTYELFRGSTKTEDGFGGGFFPKPLKTDWGTYVDEVKETKDIPFFLASDGTWRYAVTDISALLRKDEAAELYLSKNGKAADADHADEADTAAACSGNANTASALQNTVKFYIQLDSESEDPNANSFNGSSDVYLTPVGTLSVSRGGTGQSNLNLVTVGKAEKAEKDYLGQIIADTYLVKPVINTFSIPTTAWKVDNAETGSDFIRYYVITVADVTPNDIPTVVLDRQVQAEALEAGFCATAETVDNGIKVRCKEVPAKAITGSYYVMKVG